MRRSAVADLRRESLSAGMVVFACSCGAVAAHDRAGLGPPDSPSSSPVGINPFSRTSSMREGLRGTVADRAGAPVVGALILPRPLRLPAVPIPEIAVLSTEAGTFEWPLPPGEYEVVVTATGFLAAKVRGGVVPGAVTTIDVTLDRRP